VNAQGVVILEILLFMHSTDDFWLDKASLKVQLRHAIPQHLLLPDVLETIICDYWHDLEVGASNDAFEYHANPRNKTVQNICCYAVFFGWQRNLARFGNLLIYFALWLICSLNDLYSEPLTIFNWVCVGFLCLFYFNTAGRIVYGHGTFSGKTWQLFFLTWNYVLPISLVTYHEVIFICNWVSLVSKRLHPAPTRLLSEALKSFSFESKIFGTLTVCRQSTVQKAKKRTTVNWTGYRNSAE
jgi:hypothetical protein